LDDGERATEKRRDDRRRRRRRLNHPDLVKVRHCLHATGYGRGHSQPGGACRRRRGLGPVNFDNGRIGIWQIDIGFGRKSEFESGDIQRLADAVNVSDDQFDLGSECGTLFDAEVSARWNASG